MKSITVLGGGRVGATMALDLAGEFDVVVADASEVALERLRVLGIRTEKRDLSKVEEVKAAVREAELVVGAVPGFLGFQTLKSVLEAGKHVVDISFFEEDPFQLDDLAREKGVIAITDCGVAPGCWNLILGDLERRMDKILSVECLVGGLPLIRTWPYEYKAGFSPIDVLEEYTRPARYVAGGVVVTLPALSEPELVDLPGVGTLEAFNTDGLRTLLRCHEIPFMKEKTLRYPGHIEKMRMLRETGFFRKDAVPVGELRVVPIELTASLLFPLWQMGEGDEDFTVMRVIIEGEKGASRSRHVFDLLDRYDKTTGTTSMARTTGYTCTAAVRMVARGLYQRRGISPPEYLGREVGCWDFIRTELSKRGVVFRESVQADL